MQFSGVVSKGVGRFAAELILPTQERLSFPVRDWPTVPVPGTLNVRIDTSTFPDKFLSVFGGTSLKHLDSRRFAPEAELPWTDIGNNTLPPTINSRDRGRAQIWRSTIRNVSSDVASLCWVFRRIGSGISNALELVAGVKLRSALGLVDGTRVEVLMEGRWVNDAISGTGINLLAPRN